jgi:hypothetical protein
MGRRACLCEEESSGKTPGDPRIDGMRMVTERIFRTQRSLPRNSSTTGNYGIILIILMSLFLQLLLNQDFPSSFSFHSLS